MRRIRFFSFVLLLLAIAAFASAQTTTDSESQKPSDPPAFFNHSADSRFWASGQLNFIFQTHPDFPAKYSGPNSLHSQYEKATSRVLTLFL
ncbi:MAG TPA: porin, partial [Terriglobales bacterium]|nr:porin [Terriglobales bacterium]